MRSLSPLTATLLVSGLVALAVWGGFAFVFVRVRAGTAELGKMEGELAYAAQKESLLRSVKAIVADTAGERAALERYAVGKDGIVPFLNLIESAGARAGVTTEVTSVSIDADANPGAVFDALKVTAYGDGDFGSAFAFLTLLEELPYAVSAKNVSVAKKTDPEAKGVWRAVVTFTIPKVKP